MSECGSEQGISLKQLRPNFFKWSHIIHFPYVLFLAESKGHQANQVNSSKGDVRLDRSVVTVVLEKAGGGAGLGFGLDGGRDSPQGDRPLTIKKLFAGNFCLIW